MNSMQEQMNEVKRERETLRKNSKGILEIKNFFKK
jgi:hypothetical protein